MGAKIFTAEELAELALFDAEVDDEPVSMEEIRASRERDRLAKMERLDHRERRIAERQREYYEANKDAIAAYQREYREANKDAIAAYKREYNPEYYYADRPKRDDIRLRRKELGMSQAELARRVGVSSPMICMIELGRANTRQEILQEIYRVLGMEVTA